MKKTIIALFVLAGGISAAGTVQIDFGLYDSQTEGYYNIYTPETGYHADYVANYVNGATSATTTHNLNLGGKSITLTYVHTSGGEADSYKGAGLCPTVPTSVESGWKNPFTAALPTGVQGDVYDGLTTQSRSNAGSHTLIFSNLAAGTYSFSAFGGFYGNDDMASMTITLGNGLAATWTARTCINGVWGNSGASNGNSLTLDGDSSDNANHGYFFTADEITIDEGTAISITIAGAEGGKRTPLNYVSLQMVPEPTTATLSLLALAGLAARRRRK